VFVQWIRSLLLSLSAAQVPDANRSFLCIFTQSVY
jgi:hypothetical protein